MKRMTLNAAELDKFIILNDEFGFTNETLEHVSQDKLFSKIIEVINSKKPVLVFDTTNIELYVGNTDEDSMYLTALYNNSGNTYTLNYDRDTDQLRIQQASETFISEDNVKTLFGNQSIIGTGNIDLYRHFLTITDVNNEQVIFEWISSSNTNVSGNNTTKLIELLKCSGVKTGRAYGFGYKYSDVVSGIKPSIMWWIGSSSQLTIKIDSSTPTAIKEIVDIVETI